MSGNVSKTLFHPFETGAISAPAGGRAILFGAVPGYRAPSGFPRLTAVQGFRPDFLALERGGIDVRPQAEGRDYDLALILLGRHRGQNEAWLREALERTRDGGLVAVAGGKHDGIDSLRKRVAGLFRLDGHLSKHHGVVFWLSRPPDADLAGLEIMRAPETARVDGRFETAPGMFSHDRIDAASRLLAENLPAGIAGRVADFGAGWGYLASEVLKRNGGITGLDLFEADFASLEAARRNLAAAGASVSLGFYWRDLLQEPVERKYDLIVMNPPFHHARAAEPGIGQGMIRAASAALKPGGRLYLVANRGLPYEAALAGAFSASGEVCRDERFKVLRAKR